jgi:hypothetical protein
VDVDAAELTQRLGRRHAARALGTRARIVAAMGPLTIIAGLLWAVAQPYRLTILHPHGQGFWWLLSEPQLFVVLAGLAFHRFVARGLLHDLAEAELGRR